MLRLIETDDTGETLQYYRSEVLPGKSPSYVALLTAVLQQLHSSRFNHEYDVHGICNPFLQVKARCCTACNNLRDG